MYEFVWHSAENPSDILTEDGLWNLFGIPAVAARPGDGETLYHAYRRSSSDTVMTMGFDEEAYRFSQLLYGKLILDLDEVAVRPLDFGTGFRAILASLEAQPAASTRLAGVLSAAAAEAETLAADIEAMNLRYLGSAEDARADMEGAAADLNRDLYALNRLLRDAFARFNWRGAIILPHEEAGANIRLLEEASDLLRNRDGAGAVAALKHVGLGRYADYDALICDYVASRGGSGSWAAGREEGPVCRADVVIRHIEAKIEARDPDMSAEAEEIAALLAGEELRLRDILDEELSRMEEITPRIERAIAHIAPQIAEE
jgi:hypothetical protein